MVCPKNNSGAVSISKIGSPIACVVVAPFSNNSSFEVVNASDVNNNGFYAFGTQVAEASPVVFYKVNSESNDHQAVTKRAFAVPQQSVVYLEAAAAISRENKETLTSLLEQADEAGCTEVRVLFRKDVSVLRDMLGSFAACGFSLMPTECGSHVAMKFDL